VGSESPRAELENASFEWIEAFYNPRRRHFAIPNQFEALHNTTMAAA